MLGPKSSHNLHGCGRYGDASRIRFVGVPLGGRADRDELRVRAGHERRIHADRDERLSLDVDQDRVVETAVATDTKVSLVGTKFNKVRLALKPSS